MRDLTQNEIEEYLQFARATRQRPPEFDQEQAEIIGTAFLNSGMMQSVTFTVAEHVIELSPEEISGTDIMLSLLVWAFMLGRECESRLLTNALKNPKARHSGTHPLTETTCDDKGCWCHQPKARTQ